MESVWDEVKAAIKTQIPAHTFRMWIEPMDMVEKDQGNIVLSCPNSYSKKRIQVQFGQMLAAEFHRVLGETCGLSFEVGDLRPAEKNSSRKDLQLLLPAHNTQPYWGRMLREDYTFDNFVVGENNDFAYSAAFSQATKKKSNQETLFLLSKPGMGKSHLTQAVGHHILTSQPSSRIFYITAEDFLNEMVHAFRYDTIDKFKEKYRNKCDVLLLEDIQFLSGKERTQTELALTLDYLLNTGKKIIYTSSHLPSEIPKMNDQLKSRFLFGLVTNIEPPNFSTRVKILESKSKKNNFMLPKCVIEYLASELSEDVRQLESGLIGVTAKASLLGVPVDLQLAESIIKNIIQKKKNITVDVIKKLIVKYYKLADSDMVSNSRKQVVVRPRQIAMYLTRKYTDLSLQAIGRSFNRYHATAMHAIGLVEKELRLKGSIQKQVEYLCDKLESGKF
ncbi:MAG: chromosomal replication initiator protein DnaA [Desulfobacterales bacterium]|nr:chromosomal replication initiator protein DnaA [Desulfobacterales bacterium]